MTILKRERMEKRKILLAVSLAAFTGCFAQDEITINLSSGKKSYKIGDVKTLTFDGANLKVNKQDSGSDTYSFGDIVNISFDASTGVDNMKIAGGKLTVSVAPGSDIIRIGGYDARERYDVAVYSLSGEKAVGIDGWKGEGMNISSLAKGVYVLKINGTTLKFRK